MIHGLEARATEILCHSALGSRHHQVLDPNVGERSARHDQIVSAPAPVTIEIDRADSARKQILARRRRGFDRAGWRNVVSRDRVAENPQGTRAANLFNPSRFH
jgi:hypothetical protein